MALYRELLLRKALKTPRPHCCASDRFMTQTVLNRSKRMHRFRPCCCRCSRHDATGVAAPDQASAPERTDICTGCPVARDCVRHYPERLVARDDPPMAAARPRSGSSVDSLFPQPLRDSIPPPRDLVGDAAAEAIRLRILDEFRREGINVSAHSAVVGPRIFIIEVVRPRGSVAQLDRAASDVIHRITHEGESLTYERLVGAGSSWWRVPIPQWCSLAPLFDKKAEWLRARAGRFIVGCEPTGDIVTADFADPATPHLFIAGQAGSGKSWLLRAIIASLLHHHGPARFALR